MMPFEKKLLANPLAKHFLVTSPVQLQGKPVTAPPSNLTTILSQINDSGYHLQDVDVSSNVTPSDIPHVTLTIQFGMYGPTGKTVLAEIGAWVGQKLVKG